MTSSLASTVPSAGHQLTDTDDCSASPFLNSYNQKEQRKVSYSQNQSSKALSLVGKHYALFLLDEIGDVALVNLLIVERLKIHDYRRKERIRLGL